MPGETQLWRLCNLNASCLATHRLVTFFFLSTKPQQYLGPHLGPTSVGGNSNVFSHVSSIELIFAFLNRGHCCHAHSCSEIVVIGRTLVSFGVGASAEVQLPTMPKFLTAGCADREVTRGGRRPHRTLTDPSWPSLVGFIHAEATARIHRRPFWYSIRNHSTTMHQYISCHTSQLPPFSLSSFHESAHLK